MKVNDGLPEDSANDPAHKQPAEEYARDDAVSDTSSIFSDNFGKKCVVSSRGCAFGLTATVSLISSVRNLPDHQTGSLLALCASWMVTTKA